MNANDLGRIAYLAFGRYVRSEKAWEDLPKIHKLAWMAAALAVWAVRKQ